MYKLLIALVIVFAAVNIYYENFESKNFLIHITKEVANAIRFR